MQRHDAHLTHVSITVAHPDIPIVTQRGGRTGELQASAGLADGYGGEELGNGMSLQGGSCGG